MGLENNSSLESIPSQIHTQSEDDTKKTIDMAEKSKKLPKINDILVLFEGKIDENQENEIRELLNNQNLLDLEAFSKDEAIIQDIQNLNNPSEIINYLNNKFNNKTKGGAFFCQKI